MNDREKQELTKTLRDFHGAGFFEWQFSSKDHKKNWEERHYPFWVLWCFVAGWPFRTIPNLGNLGSGLHNWSD